MKFEECESESNQKQVHCHVIAIVGANKLLSPFFAHENEQRGLNLFLHIIH